MKDKYIRHNPGLYTCKHPHSFNVFQRWVGSSRIEREPINEASWVFMGECSYFISSIISAYFSSFQMHWWLISFVASDFPINTCKVGTDCIFVLGHLLKKVLKHDWGRADRWAKSIKMSFCGFVFYLWRENSSHEAVVWPGKFGPFYRLKDIWKFHVFPRCLPGEFS